MSPWGVAWLARQYFKSKASTDCPETYRACNSMATRKCEVTCKQIRLLGHICHERKHHLKDSGFGLAIWKPDRTPHCAVSRWQVLILNPSEQIITSMACRKGFKSFACHRDLALKSAANRCWGSLGSFREGKDLMTCSPPLLSISTSPARRSKSGWRPWGKMVRSKVVMAILFCGFLLSRHSS